MYRMKCIIEFELNSSVSSDYAGTSDELNCTSAEQASFLAFWNIINTCSFGGAVRKVHDPVEFGSSFDPFLVNYCIPISSFSLYYTLYF